MGKSYELLGKSKEAWQFYNLAVQLGFPHQPIDPVIPFFRPLEQNQQPRCANRSCWFYKSLA